MVSFSSDVFEIHNQWFDYLYSCGCGEVKFVVSVGGEVWLT
jgi:hypothetical protein